MEMNQKKYFLYLGMTLLFLIVVVGVSYAAYTFIGTGTTENVITTGQINVAFEEKNNILISNRYPETDTAGLANTDPNSQMTFTVSSDIVGDAVVDYAVGLVEIEEGDTLTQEDIKIYLTKSGSPTNGFTSGEGRTIEEFKDAKIEGFLDSHMIAQGSLTKTQMHTYDLKAWVNETYKLPKDESMATDENGGFVTTISEEFSFKIKVVATNVQTYTGAGNLTEPETPVLASNMIPVMYDGENWVKADVTNENPDYAWYSYANKQWANAVTVSDYEVSEKSATEEAPKAKLLNSSTLTREQLVNLPVGSVIPMERINTMWVWIPRFSADGVTFQLNEQLIEDMAESIVIYANVAGGSTTKENEIITTTTAIENNDTNKLNRIFQFHASVVGVQDVSQNIDLSDEDKSSAITSLGEDAVKNFINNNLELFIVDSLDTPTSTITITEEMIEKGYNGSVGTYSFSTEKNNISDYIDILMPYYMEEAQNNLYISEPQYNGGTRDNPGAFDITFVGTDEEAHDAFTFGEDELPGIWVGKFETSFNSYNIGNNSLNCYDNYCESVDYLEILPNKTSMRLQNVSNMFNAALSVEYNYSFGLDNFEVDTHMMKNNEWGAVAYLTHSPYGRCNSATECELVAKNTAGQFIYYAPSSNNYNSKYDVDLLIAENDDCGIKSSTGGCDYRINVDQSTTGNIYGIYDMNGGGYEAVMGLFMPEDLSNININDQSGFSMTKQSGSYSNLLNYDIKYYNGTTLIDYANANLQHAIVETAGWYGEEYDFVTTDYPWFIRGGLYSSESSSGIFAVSTFDGSTREDVAFRITLSNVEESQER